MGSEVRILFTGKPVLPGNSDLATFTSTSTPHTCQTQWQGFCLWWLFFSSCLPERHKLAGRTRPCREQMEKLVLCSTSSCRKEVTRKGKQQRTRALPRGLTVVACPHSCCLSCCFPHGYLGKPCKILVKHPTVLQLCETAGCRPVFSGCWFW